MSDNIKFKCSCCGEIHEEWPALAFISPDNYNCLSEEDKKSIGYIDSDFCTINYNDQIGRFIRCTLIQKVNDHCEDLEYGLWVSLSEKSYVDYEKNFKKDSEEKGYFGWLCNDIIDYEFSESSFGSELRPIVRSGSGSKAYRKGISRSKNGAKWTGNL